MTLVLNGTNGVSDVDGSASTPAIRGSDTNTGIFFPAADTIAFAEGGAEVARFDSSGNLGIGTSSPSYKLQVNNASASATADAVTVQNSGVNVVGDAAGIRFRFSAAEPAAIRAILTNTSNGAGALGLFTSSDGTGANITERARIDSSGNLLVGFASNPNTARMYVRYDGVSTQPVINSASTTAAGTGWSHFIGQSGNGSSITTNNVFIRGNGNLENANNSYAGISDLKLKENVTDATPKLAKLCQVRVVNFNLKADLGYESHKQIGVIAQELEQIFPGMVEETPDRDAEGNDLGTTTKNVKYSVFVPMLIKAVQEQQALIESLTARIAALEAA